MIQPPKIFCSLLDSICPVSRQDVKGDFLELYQHRVEMSGKFNANIGFLSDLITTLPLLWIIKDKNSTQHPKNMLISNLKIAQRTLVRNKLYTVINLAGISISLAACLLIAMFVRDETSFDRQFKDYKQIFRLGGNYQQGDSRIASAATTFLLQPLIEEKVSGVESISRMDQIAKPSRSTTRSISKTLSMLIQLSSMCFLYLLSKEMVLLRSINLPASLSTNKLQSNFLAGPMLWEKLC